MPSDKSPLATFAGVGFSAEVGEMPGRLGEVIRRRIEAWLRREGLRIGERLPSERELARSFSVSRPIMREALRGLEQQGLISIQPGRGIFVRGDGLTTAVQAVAASLVGYDITLDELIESRRLIETQIAGIAAERRTSSDLEAIREALAMMEGAMSSPAVFLTGDWNFHEAIASATHNRIFAMWIQPIMHHLFDSRRGVVALKDVRKRVILCHREILEAIEKKNPEQARAAANAHISQFAEDTKLGVSMGIIPDEKLENRF